MRDPKASQIERWSIFELVLQGPKEGNPFVDVVFGADLRIEHRVVSVDGFYDGDGTYRVRFMPDTLGTWSYITKSNVPELDGHTGTFDCCEPSESNHGPVQVHDTYHFAYADGTPYYQIGTTCYAWIHQGDRLEELTLETLREAPFNKLRMCVFPKHYAYNRNEPVYHPFERDDSGRPDPKRPNPAFFRHLEMRIRNLMGLGIEADLILFHPYDCWGYATMSAEEDEQYLHYLLARLAAFRNIWWSMANEYDLMASKSVADWDRLFRFVQMHDPYQHLRSIHNCRAFYDHAKPWVSHASIQRADLEQVRQWRELYHKPVVVDECQYEGNIPQRWGNISAQEMVRRFWEGMVQGGYVGHGETYLDGQDILWWSKGGRLHGQSPARIAFLRAIIAEGPPVGWEPVDGIIESRFPCVTKAGQHYLTYLGIHQPALLPVGLPAGERFAVDIIDTWDMSRATLSAEISGRCKIRLPGKPFLAVRFRKLT